MTHLVDFREKLLLPQGEALPVDRISPLIKASVDRRGKGRGGEEMARRR
jgi:hypothetical protein